MRQKKIRTALISVYRKDGLESLVRELKNQRVRIFSTGGTLDFIGNLGLEVESVEDLTSYPPILGGRVKTLHPKVFGGILQRSDNSQDQEEIRQFEIPPIDLVIVDLYPFEETVASGVSEQEIIEKIDIGGISLIRAAAKNFKDVVIVSSRNQYSEFQEIITNNQCTTDLVTRKRFASSAFDISSHYDVAIFNYFNADGNINSIKLSLKQGQTLRYGENPHQKGTYYGNFNQVIEQLHGKPVSYNNLLDIDAAICLVQDFKESVFAIIKHTNACGLATSSSCLEAYKNALAGDPVSAFGGILTTNIRVDEVVAVEIDKLFFEVLLAPEFSDKALEILKSKKNRILMIQKSAVNQKMQLRSILNGTLTQESDSRIESTSDFNLVTKRAPSKDEEETLLLANKIVKHTKSNAIVLAKKDQMISSGVGQTSRVDALYQAIEKARKFEFDLHGAIMASDAFFPFPDCVGIAYNAGIRAVIQPGGSIKDHLSINYCDNNDIAMVFTGIRHFKH